MLFFFYSYRIWLLIIWTSTFQPCLRQQGELARNVWLGSVSQKDWKKLDFFFGGFIIKTEHISCRHFSRVSHIMIYHGKWNSATAHCLWSWKRANSSGSTLASTSHLRSHPHIWIKMATQMTAGCAVWCHVSADVLGKSISEIRRDNQCNWIILHCLHRESLGSADSEWPSSQH